MLRCSTDKQPNYSSIEHSPKKEGSRKVQMIKIFTRENRCSAP
jgi:hypothetical protein